MGRILKREATNDTLETLSTQLNRSAVELFSSTPSTFSGNAGEQRRLFRQPFIQTRLFAAFHRHHLA